MPELIEAVIVATARSPIGRANKGSFVDVRADELMATILNALMDKVPEVDKSEVVDIICGNVAQQGETGFSIARTSGLLAGFPYSVPGLTVNRFCSSSLQSIRSAAHAIGAGEGHTYIAAGVEAGAGAGAAGGAVSTGAAGTATAWMATAWSGVALMPPSGRSVLRPASAETRWDRATRCRAAACTAGPALAATPPPVRGVVLPACRRRVRPRIVVDDR